MSQNESERSIGVETETDSVFDSDRKPSYEGGSNEEEAAPIAVEGPEKLVDAVCALHPRFVPARSFGGPAELVLIVRENVAPRRDEKDIRVASRLFLSLRASYEKAVRSLPSARGPARSDPRAEALRRKRLARRQAFVGDWAQLMADHPELCKADYWRLDGRPRSKQWVDYNEARKLCGEIRAAQRAQIEETPKRSDEALANGCLQCWRGPDESGAEEPWVIDPATGTVLQRGTGEPDANWVLR